MTLDTTKTIPTGKIRSEILGILREIDGAKKFTGPLAQFVLVVDANIILGDLIWLVSKRKKSDATTELMECIAAGTIVAYVTRQVIAEVERIIPKIASDKNISEQALYEEWRHYHRVIKTKTPPKDLVERYKSGQDPDDAPTIALEKMIRASGILSKDSDLVAMGGLVIEMDFTKLARDYSRKTAVAATIRYGGGIVLVVSVNGMVIAIKTIKEILKNLPPEIKISILFAACLVASNKRNRDWVILKFRRLLATIRTHIPGIINVLASISTIFAEHTVDPPRINHKIQNNSL